jgi:hypothetical protein
MARTIKFVCYAKRWFDRVNGNTYHSVRVVRVADGAVIVGAFQYGYGDQYRQTALEIMARAGWLPKKYTDRDERGRSQLYMYDRENGYPVEWFVTDGLKRDCVANGELA